MTQPKMNQYALFFKNSFLKTIRAFKKSCAGISMILFGILGMLLILFTGVMVDYGREQILQSALQSSLDATSLAKSRDIFDNSYLTKTRPYFDRNFDNYLSSRVTDFRMVVNPTRDTLTVAATTTIPTVFLQIFGLREMRISAVSAARVELNTLEIAMALDNTGSMDGVNMDALKVASSTFINQIYTSRIFQNTTYTSIIPFNATVNIGRANAGWTTNEALDWGSTAWAGCIEARDGALDTIDTPPNGGNTRYDKYYWECRASTNPYADNEWKAGCTGAQTGILDGSFGPNKECQTLQEIQPLSRNRAALLTTLNDMFPIGSTHINLGLAWGWNTISPQWRGFWRGEAAAANLPGPYNNPKFFKAIILMTDGDNTIYTPDAYSGYDFVSAGKLGSTQIPAAVAEMNNRLEQLCTNIKRNNVMIITLGLGAGLRADTIARLSRCATAPEFAFTPKNAGDLNAAYQSIMQRLTDEAVTVRLVR